MFSINYGEKVISLTEREAIVWDRLIDISQDGSVGDISDFGDLGSRQSIGGVISSLVSKGLVMVDGASVVERAGEHFIWPNHPEHGAVFLCDYCSDDEANALKTNTAMVAID